LVFYLIFVICLKKKKSEIKKKKSEIKKKKSEITKKKIKYPLGMAPEG
jgi:hypothetical protein